jgi:Uma2 family endonuclease
MIKSSAVSSTWSPVLGGPEPLQGRRITLAEWLALPEDVEGELVDDRLREEEMPDAIHELAVSWLICFLRGWIEGEGFVFGSELKLAISERRGRKADVAVFLPGRRPPPRRGRLAEPPDIVVEVVTPTPRDERRDRIEKMTDYAELGVASYWLLDPALRSLEVFQLGADGRYVRALGATGGRVSVPGLDRLELDLEALFAELDRLGPEED